MKYVTSVERLAIERGMQQGMQQGLQQGMLQGIQQGRQQGMQQGEVIGEAKVLHRQLTKRFGTLTEDARKRLQTATTEQLELWADRILEAPTLAAVFDEH